MKKGKEDKIPKPLLIINNFILVIGSIADIIGLIFFIKYMMEIDLKYNKTESAYLYMTVSANPFVKLI
ncbi:hypothetical protein BST92_14180 [Nonlabens arenilitoris]|uniref:Uncharacterized protein n=1 Tax=Nonlabens arenilitoris TaxID=1217969 RepID=A0A2S7UDP2_9FLAO|nr:hypothetical protein [Nonlabens arenilitoris]PQJ32999.1 hypothetical protein BST92_14180 [Nonlabens arenilitoris]